ncbi:MAG: hypothetical protein COU85_01820 [Candidatus Portnoybacteria bacterium CG10_big_fil_rev_8_21_14_0_10_44_7]|uniref:Uncharacterized protein n=1 Tax=Candidatus Portnoybacteria bacterium CG10_big_fil_rev_8_21_14_0_10_44_7 TaxID=1974816 RepID=A0A2M8KIP5_9BACT|nr:MAG: hypothetical protein COU85_01820 [Candidatus Portnoybacteria bacterium CG10_big_fil_rev_8_21_14_0_10_44_7]
MEKPRLFLVGQVFKKYFPTIWRALHTQFAIYGVLAENSFSLIPEQSAAAVAAQGLKRAVLFAYPLTAAEKEVFAWCRQKRITTFVLCGDMTEEALLDLTQTGGFTARFSASASQPDFADSIFPRVCVALKLI